MLDQMIGIASGKFAGRQQVDGLIVAAGFSGHGVCLGPITGQILADLAVFGTTELPIDAFQLSRFDGEGQDAAALTLHG